MMRLSRRSLADLGLLILVDAMWGAQFTAYKLVSGDIGPLTVGAWIFLIAGVVLVPFVVGERRHRPCSQESDLQDRSIGRSLLSKRNLAGFSAISLFGLVPASDFMAWGVARSTASNSALINLTIPIITALLAVAMLRERMTAARWSSLFVSLAGVLILSDLDWRHLAEEIPLAGHPTISTIWALIESGQIVVNEPHTRVTLELKVGVIPIDIY